MTNAAPTSQRDNLPAWVPTDQVFGTRLAMIRQNMQWNLKEASIQCGLGQNDWARYEGGMNPRDLINVARKISARTGADLDWLVFGVPAVARQPWAVPANGDLTGAIGATLDATIDELSRPIGGGSLLVMPERGPFRARTGDIHGGMTPVEHDATVTPIRRDPAA